jgi:lipopolysaccharide transport system permease protein
MAEFFYIMSKKSTEFQILIDPNRIHTEYFKDLFRFRELFFFFAWRDILIRYKQTFLGIAWSIIRPLINMAVFAFVFGKVANLSSDGINYSVFVLAGMLPWQLFCSCIMDASSSLLNNSHMISKIYFPRIILPVSHIIVNFVDFSISLFMMFIVLLVIGLLTHWTILCIPFFVALTLLFCLGASLWIAAVMVRYRDFRFIIPFIVQFGMFISPVGYGSFIVPERWRFFYFLNPMAGIIDGFRWCFFGTYHADFSLSIGLSIAMTLIILVFGFRFFRKMERVIADII